MRQMPKPAGIFGADDDRARTVARLCFEECIDVPRQVAILGAGNDETICLAVQPPLSSIALNAEQKGGEAAGLLASIIAGHRPRALNINVLPVQPVLRQSTNLTAVDDFQVGKALRYLRDNCGKRVLVSELSTAAGLSRRALQDAFLRSIGRTPIEEIHAQRVERIARMLVETDFPMGKIAESCGFNADTHFSRFFARRAGMTPQAYRTKHRGR